MYMCCQNASCPCSLMPPSAPQTPNAVALLGTRKVLVHCQSASRPRRRRFLLHTQAPPRCSRTVTDQKGAAVGMQKQAVTLSASLQSQSVSSWHLKRKLLLHIQALADCKQYVQQLQAASRHVRRRSLLRD